MAEKLIAELGAEAGYRVGYLARYENLPPAASERLQKIVQEIERRQGFGWWFADDPPDLKTTTR